MRKGLFFLLLTLLLLPSLALAQSTLEQDYQRYVQPFSDSATGNTTVTVGENAVVNDNFVRFVNTANIDGDVQGDVIIVGNSLTINGKVSGDVIAAADKITINGPVAGNVRVAGGEVVINNTVGKNVNIFAGKATLSKQALVSWSLSFFAGDIEINSPVGGNIYGFGGKVVINNTVGTDVTLTLDELGEVTLMPEAVISGNFSYRGEKNAVIQTGAVINGDTVHKLVSTDIFKARKFLSQAWIYSKIIGLFALLLVGTIIISLFRKKTEAIAQTFEQNPAPKFLWGFLLLIATPLAAFILTLTIIGIPLALMLMAGYIFLLYISKIFIGLIIGQKILRIKKKVPLIWTMMLGVFLFFILINIPYVGWIFSLIGTIWFLGTIWQIIFPKKDARALRKDYAENQTKNI